MSVTGNLKYHTVKGSDITMIAHLEEAPIVVLLECMKWLLNLTHFLCSGKFIGLSQVVIGLS
jgi:hypothetical protein